MFKEALCASNLFASVIFGGIGVFAFLYGKKERRYKTMALGIALSVYPFFVQKPIAVIAVGVGLTAALFIFRD